jgi:hypothetical protein
VFLLSVSKDNFLESPMDAVVIDVYSRMVLSHHCSADLILETPELRQEYLANMRQQLGDVSEQKLLHALMTMRKRSKLPRSRDILHAIHN